jgi:hypothetical protein
MRKVESDSFHGESLSISPPEIFIRSRLAILGKPLLQSSDYMGRRRTSFLGPPSPPPREGRIANMFYSRQPEYPPSKCSTHLIRNQITLCYIIDG